MNCPKCKDVPLVSGKLKSKQLEVDQCTQCKGIWFDTGELASILGKKAAKPFFIPKTAAISPFVVCPRCSENLYEFCYPGTTTAIDACEDCDGIWLDNKEWSAISKVRKVSDHSELRKEPEKREAPIIDKDEVQKPLSQNTQTMSTHTSTDSTRIYNNIDAASDLDDIPGLKGYLLRTIDNAIHRLS